MKLTIQQQHLFEFVKAQHGEQVRKYSGEPYYTHLFRVAEIVSEYNIPMAIEVALCHDLFEDTSCDFSKLHKELVKCVYNRRESYEICTMVKELTDIFTHENFPYYNRKKRKELEAQRLSTSCYTAQSVKYCDLLDNTVDIVKNDKEFAKVYLSEKKRIIELMINGKPELLERCKKLLISIDKL